MIKILSKLDIRVRLLKFSSLSNCLLACRTNQSLLSTLIAGWQEEKTWDCSLCKFAEARHQMSGRSSEHCVEPVQLCSFRKASVGKGPSFRNSGHYQPPRDMLYFSNTRVYVQVGSYYFTYHIKNLYKRRPFPSHLPTDFICATEFRKFTIPL